jgi:hypothetical protein
LDQSQKEARALSTEVRNLRSAQDVAKDQIDALKRDNKHLQEEIADLTKQLGEGGEGQEEARTTRASIEGAAGVV